MDTEARREGDTVEECLNQQLEDAHWARQAHQRMSGRGRVTSSEQSKVAHESQRGSHGGQVPARVPTGQVPVQTGWSAAERWSSYGQGEAAQTTRANGATNEDYGVASGGTKGYNIQVVTPQASSTEATNQEVTDLCRMDRYGGWRTQGGQTRSDCVHGSAIEKSRAPAHEMGR